MSYRLWKVRGVPTALTVRTLTNATEYSHDMTTLSATMAAVDGTNGNKFANVAGNTFVWIKNTHATDDLLITFVTPYTVSGIALADKTITLDANDEVLVGPFPATPFNDADRNITVNFAESGGTGAVAAAKIGVFKLALT